MKILYIVDGTMEISTGAFSQIVGPGSIVCFNNFEEQKIRVCSSACLRYLILIDPRQFELLIQDPRIISIFKTSFGPGSILLPGETSGIRELILRMQEEARKGSEHTEGMLRAMLYELAVSLFRECPDHFPRVMSGTQLTIYSVQKYIDENFSQKITQKDLQEKFFLSESYLIHSFKKCCGYSPMQYLNLRRLSFSRHLLLHSSMTVAEVSERCGFNSPESFTKAFKKLYSVPPGRIRSGEL